MIVNVAISYKIFNDVYKPFLNDKSRYLVFYGGGSSGKSYFIAQRYIYKCLNQKMNLLVVRQTGNTNRDSTFALLKHIISEWKVDSLFKISESNLRIKCVNGNEIIFRGLDDPEKIKSVTFENGELTDVWIEEATECQEAAINQLKVRMRGGTSDKQMVLSFNPVSINHWIKKHFIDSKIATVCHSTYKDNKYLTEEDRKTLESFKDTDPYYYSVYCLGEWGVLGKTFFDAKKITYRLRNLKEPIKTGSFIYDINNNEISNIKFKEDKDGCINIYDIPRNGYPYVLAGDTAGEGSDYFTGQVIDNITGKQVAKLRKQFDADEYTRQMYCLGMYYNEALIAIEANFDTYPIKKLYEYGYHKQYVREREDNYTDKHIQSFGFKTTAITRPLVLSMLQEIVNQEIEKITDRDTLEEMLTFVRNTKGRPEAQEGAHDDLIMALAIVYYARTQQRMKVEVVRDTTNYFNFDAEKETSNDVYQDYGSEIVVI